MKKSPGVINFALKPGENDETSKNNNNNNNVVGNGRVGPFLQQTWRKQRGTCETWSKRRLWQTKRAQGIGREWQILVSFSPSPIASLFKVTTSSALYCGRTIFFRTAQASPVNTNKQWCRISSIHSMVEMIPSGSNLCPLAQARLLGSSPWFLSWACSKKKWGEPTGKAKSGVRVPYVATCP